MADAVTLGHAAHPPPEDAVEDIDVDGETHKNSVHQRLRANSSIMQVKKLLGMSFPHW